MHHLFNVFREEAPERIGTFAAEVNSLFGQNSLKIVSR